jgi:hypothetical protein
VIEWDSQHQWGFGSWVVLRAGVLLCLILDALLLSGCSALDNSERY